LQYLAGDKFVCRAISGWRDYVSLWEVGAQLVAPEFNLLPQGDELAGAVKVDKLEPVAVPIDRIMRPNGSHQVARLSFKRQT